MIRRYLECRGYAVMHVQNFTDIDDKIINRASRARRRLDRSLIERYIAEYLDQIDGARRLPADVYPARDAGDRPGSSR